MPKEIKIGNKIIGENTKISLTVKMALYLIGGIILIFSTAFTIAYFDVKKDVKDYKAALDKEKKEFIISIENKFEKKVEDKFKDVQDIKINVGIILDRTQYLRAPSVAPRNTPTVNTNIPPPTPPPN